MVTLLRWWATRPQPRRSLRSPRRIPFGLDPLDAAGRGSTGTETCKSKSLTCEVNL
jgi:hypothetical protein